MERRQFLKGMGALTTGAVAMSLPMQSFANFSKNSESKSLKLVNAKKQFNAALKYNPALIGFANIEKNFAPQQLTIEGKLPKEIAGSFYRNGPATHERADKRYLHLFEGDGMVHQFNFSDGKIYHQGKFVETPKFQQEQAAGKFLYSGPDSRLDNSIAVRHADMVNAANTNVIPVGDDLWALWEGGSATALNAKTLATKGQVNLGKNSQYGDKLKGLAFSAHPKIEANGDIWNFGLSSTGHVALFHLSASGNMKNVGMVNAQYRGNMLHDFLITHKHILLILPALETNPNINGFFAQIKHNSQLPMRVLVIDKQSLTVKKQYHLASGFAFHYGNAWEEKDGTIHFDASMYNNIDVLHSLGKVMLGDSRRPNRDSKTVLFTLKPNGTSSSHSIEGDSEFPRIFAEKTGIKNNYLFTLSANESEIWSDTVSCLHIESGKKDSFIYGKDFLVEEHIPINPKKLDEQGYLIGTALHIPSKRTCINIFKSDSLSDGPICRAWLPYHIPLGFHGNFKAS